MTVRQAAEKLNLTILAGEAGLDREIKSVFCCDLLSFAMGKAPADSAWITVMGNANVIAVAALADIACAVLAEGAQPDEGALEKANGQGIPLLRSGGSIFETAKAVDGLLG